MHQSKPRSLSTLIILLAHISSGCSSSSTTIVGSPNDGGSVDGTGGATSRSIGGAKATGGLVGTGGTSAGSGGGFADSGGTAATSGASSTVIDGVTVFSVQPAALCPNNANLQHLACYGTVQDAMYSGCQFCSIGGYPCTAGGSPYACWSC